MLIDGDLEDLGGVENANTSYAKGECEVEFDEKECNHFRKNNQPSPKDGIYRKNKRGELISFIELIIIFFDVFHKCGDKFCYVSKWFSFSSFRSIQHYFYSHYSFWSPNIGLEIFI